MIERYPDAKVLLTLHPKGPEAWHRSTVNTIHKLTKLWEFKLLALLVPKMRKMARMSRSLIWDRSHRNTIEYRDKAISRYEQHIEEVRAAVPAERLLVYSVDQGWGPLCEFLGKPLPDRDFPKVNDSQEFQAFLNKFRRIAYGMIGLASVLAAGIAFALARG